MKRLAALITLATTPGLALAHGAAGHGFMASLEHIITSAHHLWPLAVVAVVAAALKRPIRRLVKQRINHRH